MRLCSHAPTSIFKVKGERKKGVHQHLNPGRTYPCPYGKCFKTIKLMSFMYSPGSSLIAAFVLNLRMSEITYKPLKRNISNTTKPSGSPRYKPHWFPKPGILGAQSLQYWSQGSGCTMWGPHPLLLSEYLKTCEISFYHGLSCWRWGFDEPASLSLLPILAWAFNLLLWNCCSASYQLFLRGNIFYMKQ